jgi:hypothetical protein
MASAQPRTVAAVEAISSAGADEHVASAALGGRIHFSCAALQEGYLKALAAAGGAAQSTTSCGVPTLLSLLRTTSATDTAVTPGATADLAVMTLGQLLGVPRVARREQFWGAPPEAVAGVARELLAAGGVEALLADLERRADAFEAYAAAAKATSNGGKAGGGNGAASANTAAGLLEAARLMAVSASVLCVLNLADRPRSIVGLHTYGVGSFVRLFTRLNRAATSACPTPALVPHLVLAAAFRWYHSDMLYADTAPLGLEPATLRGLLKSAHEADGDALLDALWPTVFACDDADVREHPAYARLFIDIFRHAGLGLACAKRGGFARLFRECTDAHHGAESLMWLFLACNNGARSRDIAATMLEAGAAQLLTPALYHDDRNVQFQAALALSCIASHRELRPALEASGCTDEMVMALRAISPLDLPLSLVFSDVDVGIYVGLCGDEQLKAVRHTGGIALAWVAANYGTKGQLEAGLHLLERTGGVSALMTLARHPDAFIYSVAATALKQLKLPVPYYRDPARDSAQAGGLGSDDGGGGGGGGGLALPADVLSWDIDTVCAWVGAQPFKVYRPAFRDSFVSGYVLACLSDDDLREMGVASGVHRKAIRAAIAKRLARAGQAYSHTQGLVAAAPAAGGGRPASGAAATLLSRAEAAAAPTPLQEAPVTSDAEDADAVTALAAYQAAEAGAGAGPGTAGLLPAYSAALPGGLLFAYSEAASAAGGGSGGAAATPMLARSASLPLYAAMGHAGPAGVPLPAGALQPVDVFISYRRRTGAVLAQLIKTYLRMRGLTTFLDVENLGQGDFDVALQRALSAARNVVVVLSEGALDRCMQDYDGKDFVRKELAMALAMRKNVVPVTLNFAWPDESLLPPDIRGLCVCNSVDWSHSYQEASMERLARFLVK